MVAADSVGSYFHNEIKAALNEDGTPRYPATRVADAVPRVLSVLIMDESANLADLEKTLAQIGPGTAVTRPHPTKEGVFQHVFEAPKEIRPIR